MIYLRLETKKQLDSLNLELSHSVIISVGDYKESLFSDGTESVKISIDNNTITDYCWNDGGWVE